MSFLDNIRNGGTNAPAIGSVNFVIYTMDVLKDPAYILADGNPQQLDETELDEAVVAAGFQGLRNFAMRMQTNIPYEVLENGEFSSDSIGGTPFEIGVVAEVAPIFSDEVQNDQQRREYIGEVEDLLKDALANDTQLVILQNTPLFNLYTNIKLNELVYDISVDQLNMVAFMKFQQIRITNAEYGYTPVNQVDGAHNASVRENGASVPQTPKQDVQDLLS